MAGPLSGHRRPSRWTAPLIASGAALLFGLVGLSQWELWRNLRAVETAAEAQRALLEDLADVRALEKAVADMESGTRGYLLTGLEEVLEPTRGAGREFDDTVAQLRARWAAAPDRSLALDSVAALAGEWRTRYMQPVVERRRAARSPADFAAIDAIVARGDGRRILRGVRDLSDHLENRLSAEIRAATLETNRLADAARAFALRMSLSILLAIGFMAAVIGRGFRALRERARDLAREAARRERAERSDRASEARFEAFLNGLSEALLIADANGRITWFNPRLPALFGIPPDALAGAGAGRLLVEADRGRIEEAFTDLRSGGRARIETEATALAEDGRAFPAELSLARFDAPEGLRFAIVIRDASERKAVERLKSEFVASVSHELRTPLTAIVGALALLRAGDAGELAGATRAFVDMAHDNSLRLARLVDDVIDVERIDSGALAFRPAEFPLEAFLEEAVRLNQAYAQARGVFLYLDEPVPRVALRADRDRLMQAVTNLLSNAAKFSPRGEEVRVAASRADGRVRIAVADRGPGIPEEFRPRVFEKFAQADASDSREKGGTGLGLAIAQAIVERSGGRIGFETATGRGTTFWIEMPEAAAGA